MIEILIDNRLRIAKGALPPAVLRELRFLFTHANPMYHRQRAMGFLYTNEPRVLTTWGETSTHDTFPRGGLASIRQALDAAGIEHDEIDQRTSGGKVGSFTGDWVTPKIIPDHRVQLWPHQQRIVQTILQREQALVRSGTGCIAGDTMIGINRAGKGAQVRLDHIVHMHHDGKGRTARWFRAVPPHRRVWDPEVPTFVRARMDDGTVRLVRMLDAYVSGYKQVFELRLVSGHCVQATKDHRFLTQRGWVRLGELQQVSDSVYAELSDCCTELSQIDSIRKMGELPTYDLTLEAPHNFLANGIVVHNSGKTTALLGAIAAVQLPTLVIVWDSRLLEQWQERIEKEMGIARKDLGLVQGKKHKLRPITMAMQQTLQRLPPSELQALMAQFGFVAGDEIQRAAAKTYEYVFDAVTARFKVGVSANETRKDGKDPLIYDQFGQVAIEIATHEIVKAGFVVDVHIRLLPTQFDAPWYRELKEHNEELEEGETKERPDFGRLIDEMTSNEARNRLIAEFVAARVQEGRRMFVFTHRVQHAIVLDSLLTGLGVRSGRMLGAPENRTEFNATKRALGQGTKDVGVGTYQAIGVGQDIPAVDAGFATTPIHTNKQAVGQIKGRMCRAADGKTEGVLYVAYDPIAMGAYPARALAKLSSDTRIFDDVPGLWVPVRDYLKTRRIGDGETISGSEPQQSGSPFASAQRRYPKR